MSSELQKRLYEMEVKPPETVWANLAATLDEINEDNRLAKKLSSVNATAPAGMWESIQSKLEPQEKKSETGNLIYLNLKRLAVAAIIIGIAITTWLMIRNTNNGNGEIVQSGDSPVAKGNAFQQALPKTENVINDSPRTNEALAIVPPKISANKNKNQRNNIVQSSKQKTLTQQENTITSVLQKELQGGKSFDKKIDDLSLITASDNYMTMVNANGRLSKIPIQFAHLAPHLQDKPVTEDYFEVLFGEGTYWKETMNEWRKKVASAPVSSGDAFTSFIELLKTVQGK
jgi:hypothetical protein